MGPLGAADGVALADLAAAVVHALLRGASVDGRPPRSPALRQLGCSFVTLRRRGTLRGCIGTLEPVRPLYRDVAGNAERAIHDPRLPPVTGAEWPELDVSVSVLDHAEVIPAAGLAELRRLVRPYRDGLILSVGDRRATLLPAVWENLPNPDDFLRALLHKGGWPTNRLPRDAQVRRYTTSEFHDTRAHLEL